MSVGPNLATYNHVRKTADPAVANVVAFTGSGGGTTTNTGRMFIALKPLEERKIGPGLGGGLPGLGGPKLPGLGGGFPGLPGVGKKK